MSQKIIFKTLFITLFVMLSTNSFSQKNNIDVIYLKDGSIIKGELIEIKTDQYVKIKTFCDNILVYKNIEIDKIIKEEHQNKKEVDYNKLDFSGGMGDISLGLLIGSKNSTDGPGFSAEAEYIHEFKNNFAIGGGLGINVIDKSYLSLFNEVRYTFLENKNSHFVYCKTGYSFVTEDYEADSYYGQNIIDSYGGVLINPGIGVTFKINESNSASIKIGYVYAEDREDTKDYNGRKIERLHKYNRFEFRIGYTFR